MYIYHSSLLILLCKNKREIFVTSIVKQFGKVLVQYKYMSTICNLNLQPLPTFQGC